MTRCRLLWLIWVVTLLAVSTLAQDLDETYTWDDYGVSMDYPDDWEVVEEEDTVSFRSEETDILIYFDDNYDLGDNLADYIEDAFEEYRFDESERFENDEVVIDDIATYFFEDVFDGEEFDRVIFAIPLTDELLAIAIVLPRINDEIDEIDLVFDILATLRSEGSGSDNTASEKDFVWNNDYSISLEDGWQEEDDVFSNGDIDIEFFFYDVDDEREVTRGSSLRTTYDDVLIGDVAFDEDNIAFLTLENDSEAIEYSFDDIDGDDIFATLIVSFMLNDDTVIVAVVRPSDGDGDDVYDYTVELYSFLETMDD